SLHRLPCQVFCVGVAGRVPALHPHPEAERDATRGGFEDALVEGEAASGAVFEEQIRVVASPREGGGEQALAEGGVDGAVSPRCEGGAVCLAERHGWQL